MKYSANMSISTNHETWERFTDEKNIYNYFKELFGKKRSRVIEESFSAPEILSKFNAAFKNAGINNLVRLTHDDVDFFLDTENKTNDLDDGINQFRDVLQESFERFYEEISVVMESSQHGIDFVVELLILRVHPVGEYPIQINFSGLAKNTKSTNIENSFNLFVNKVELNITKFIKTRSLTVSFTKNIEGNTLEPGRNTGTKPQTDKCAFFPLYDITLGKTTVKELAAKGTRSKGLDSDKKPYKFYIVHDMNFWFSENIANHMYLTYTSPIPDSWRECGFDWHLSYNKWLALFKDLGFFISTVQEPTIEWYRSKKTLAAEFRASKKISSDVQLVFSLYFNYSLRTSVDAKRTIYSLGVRVE